MVVSNDFQVIVFLVMLSIDDFELNTISISITIFSIVGTFVLTWYNEQCSNWINNQTFHWLIGCNYWNWIVYHFILVGICNVLNDKFFINKIGITFSYFNNYKIIKQLYTSNDDYTFHRDPICIVSYLYVKVDWIYIFTNKLHDK